MIPVKDYSGSTMGNLPIGQGLSVTPMQMAAAYSAIADGGILRTPRLVESEDGVKTPVDAGKRVISRKDSAELRKMLEGVLAPGGTASEVSVPGYTLAGKTGTAQKVIDGTYSDTQFVASFVGFAPADRTRSCWSRSSSTTRRATITAAQSPRPAFGEIAKFALPYLRNSAEPGLTP